MTFLELSWHGDHTIKTGVKFKDVELQMRDASTDALYSFYVSPDPPDAGIDPDPFEVKFGALAINNDLPVTTTSKNRQYGIYLQDDWVVNDRLTLNLGVRYDYEETPTYTDYVTPQRFVDAIIALDTNACPVNNPSCLEPGQTYAESLANGGIDINDYISNGSNRSNPSDQIAPRFGFSYDINADQEHVIFGGAGPQLRPQRIQHPAARDQQGRDIRSDDPVLERHQPQWQLPAEHAGQSVLHPVGRRLPDAGRAAIDCAGPVRGDALHQQQPEGAVFRSVHPRHAQPGGRLEHERRVGVHHELRRRDRQQRQPLR